MKLRSPFKDYYDVALAHGQDSDIVYLRYPKEEDLGERLFYSLKSHGCKNLFIERYILGFCDKIYQMLEVNLINSDYSCKEDRNRRRFCYSVEHVDSFIKGNFKEKDYELYVDKKLKDSWSMYENRDMFINFFKSMNEEKVVASYKKYFKDHPVFLISPVNSYYSKENSVINYNPCLKDYEFYKVSDSYAAFQEISMWFGNRAVPMKEIPVMSDEIKIGAHGYDKWSFRKEPSKKGK